MHVAWLELTDFRSYRRLEWRPDPGVNLLIGPNGAGKTNALEAVGYLATLRSFRGVGDEALVNDEAERAYVRGGVDRGGDRGEALIEVEVPRRGPRRAQLDRQRLRRISDLVEIIRVVTFLPEDLDLVKRGPARRRDLLDEAAVQLRPAAALDFAEYDRAVRQRNAFLKMGAPDEVTLSVWDERMSQAGGKVMARRAAVMTELAPYMEDAYRAISGSSSILAFSYSSEWGGSPDPTIGAAEHARVLAEAIAASRRQDMERRVSTVGPHRDDPALLLDGHDVRVHGSQGEQRSTALAVRLAVHRAVTERTGAPPLLLLDDVFSELDEGRAERLAAALPPAQTLISSARPEDVPIRGRRWDVSDGKLEEAS
ncbi:MAG: DNA replication/repair protein RecF [Actinomycetes bacterium]|nr:DNA replication/repair protein RecF [Acidimicrobiia bacterium]